MADHAASRRFLELLEIDCPIIQAPMAGTSTPEMAAAVSNAGGLGSMGVGAMTPAVARDAIAAFRDRSNRSLNVNVFCHRPAVADPSREAAWLARLRPEFERVGAAPPGSLREIYKSFVVDEAMFRTLLAAKPKVVSFHFGLPDPAWIRALREAGTVLLGTSTSLDEGRALAAAGWMRWSRKGTRPAGIAGRSTPTPGTIGSAHLR